MSGGLGEEWVEVEVGLELCQCVCVVGWWMGRGVWGEGGKGGLDGKGGGLLACSLQDNLLLTQHSPHRLSPFPLGVDCSVS